MHREELLAELWRRFKGGDAQARDYLVLEYAPWARRVAASVQRRLPTGIVEWQDHVQNSHIGMLEAMDRYDPARGIPFELYAQPRVRGAVFNGVRQLRRSGRGELEPMDQVDGGETIAAFVSLILDAATEYIVEQAADASPEGTYKSSQIQQLLGEAMMEMPERTRNIFVDHYYLHKPFNQVAEELGISKGRVSQLHSRGLEVIRARLLHGGTTARDFF